MSTLQKAREISQLCWAECFYQKPYTTFWMIDYLLQWIGISYEAYIQDPSILKNWEADLDIANSETSDFEELVTFPGRCTTFALQTVEKIKAMGWDETEFDFQFYDLSGHRLARCKNTGILIDSSSSIGAFVLEEGEWKTFDGRRSWKWESGESAKFSQTGSPHHKVSSTPLSRRECMVVCLREIVAEGTKPLCLFRDYSESEVKYFGMMEWQLQKRRLLLAKDRSSREDMLKAIYIVWDGKGNEDTEIECRSLTDRFHHRSGAINCGLQQWTECSGPHWRIWDTASKLWGYPRAVPALPEKDDDKPLMDYEVEDAFESLGLYHFS